MAATMNSSERERALERIAAAAKLMDSQFCVPGTNFRFGLESIIGLVPGGGDAIGFMASAGLVLTMARHGASPQLVARMLLNVALDATVGAIPLLGDLFDMTFKANNRNVELLRRHYEEDRYQGSAWPVVLGALAVLLVMGAALAWVLWRVGEWFFGLF